MPAGGGERSAEAPEVRPDAPGQEPARLCRVEGCRAGVPGERLCLIHHLQWLSSGERRAAEQHASFMMGEFVRRVSKEEGETYFAARNRRLEQLVEGGDKK